MYTVISTLFIEPALQKFRLRCALALYVLILVLGSVPGARQDIGEYASGGFLHATANAGLTLLLFCGRNGTRMQRGVKAV